MSGWLAGLGRSPWGAWLALASSLFGQALLEPPRRWWPLGVALLLVGVALWWRSLASREAEACTFEVRFPTVRVRWVWIGVAASLGTAAFWLFRGNRWSWLNLSLWLGALVAGVGACWQREEQRKQREPWAGRLPLLPFVSILLMAVVFRLVALSQVPANPWSDHAEKLEDVCELGEGTLRVFFPRNTGREGLQMYWTFLVGKLAGTGVSFESLKLGTALFGLLTVPLVFFLAREIAGSGAGFAAMFFFGVAYWPNVISRIGLRFPLYPLFAAAVLLSLFRGLCRGSGNDLVLTGVFLGLGLHGYTAFRIVPFVVVVLLAFAWFQQREEAGWGRLVAAVAVVGWLALLVFLPLASFALSGGWGDFWFRSTTRVSGVEHALPGPAVLVFLENVVRALAMGNLDNGEIFAISVPGRPALDVASAALFLLGATSAAWHWVRQRCFPFAALLLALPLLQLPSSLSLAFPNENPAPNRAAAAAVVMFVLVGVAAARLWQLQKQAPASGRLALGLLFGASAVFSAWQNARLVFAEFATANRAHHFDSNAVAWVVQEFLAGGGKLENVHIVRVPHWMDTRLPALLAGVCHVDLGLDRELLDEALTGPGRKLFIVKDDDNQAQEALREKAPGARFLRYPTNAPPGFFLGVVVEGSSAGASGSLRVAGSPG